MAHLASYPQEHQRNGTAKLRTLFHPATGQVRVKGVTTTVKPVLYGWLKAERRTWRVTGADEPPQLGGDAPDLGTVVARQRCKLQQV